MCWTKKKKIFFKHLKALWNNSKTSLRSMKYINWMLHQTIWRKMENTDQIVEEEEKIKNIQQEWLKLERLWYMSLWCRRWINSEYLIWKIATCSFTLKILKLFRFEVYSSLFEGNCKLISKLWYRNLNH